MVSSSTTSDSPPSRHLSSTCRQVSCPHYLHSYSPGLPPNGRIVDVWLPWLRHSSQLLVQYWCMRCRGRILEVRWLESIWYVVTFLELGLGLMMFHCTALYIFWTLCFGWVIFFYPFSTRNRSNTTKASLSDKPIPPAIQRRAYSIQSCTSAMQSVSSDFRSILCLDIKSSQVKAI